MRISNARPEVGRRFPTTRLVAVCLILAIASGTGTRRPGPLRRLTHDGLDKQRPAWSPDGLRIAFARQELGGLHLWQYVMEKDDPMSLRRLTKSQAPDYNGVFSPDGKRLLFVVNGLSGTQGNLDIAAINADGTAQVTITSDHGKLSHQDWPAWSADGLRFAFSSTHDGNQEIYTGRLDGSDVQRVTQSPGIDAHPCWSPDGRALYFSTDRWGGLEIAKVHRDGTGLTRLTRCPGLDDYPACSPDGTRLAFVSNRDGQFEIYLTLNDGTSPENLSRHPLRDCFPTWTPDGRGVTFVSNRDGGFDIYTQYLQPGVDSERITPD